MQYTYAIPLCRYQECTPDQKSSCALLLTSKTSRWYHSSRSISARRTLTAAMKLVGEMACLRKPFIVVVKQMIYVVVRRDYTCSERVCILEGVVVGVWSRSWHLRPLCLPM